MWSDKMDFLMRRLTHEEQSKQVLPLLGVCFPAHWKIIAETCCEMPFEEISFGAFDGDLLVGHCGLVPHDILVDGQWYPVAGIASVAVAPTHQKKGIAKRLCDYAARWAAEQGFTLMPLYTEFFRVYESANWQKFPIPETVVAAEPFGCRTAEWQSGAELSRSEKASIVNIYENGENFNGKIRRLMSGKLQSWERIFRESNSFVCNSQMYAAAVDGVLAELYFLPEVTDDEKRNFFLSLGNLPCYLPPTASIKKLMAEYQWQISSADAMHGERPMVRMPQTSNHVSDKLNTLFFALLDKF